ncbi:hypothetical protein IWQ60_012409 [Tieghemiomyces parasiticus]|uniref:GH18 domain-containing protein n=1 Tax=Tieghemiomyces parasiticus TaxID=78921 RepID=A0A9W7ZNR2_9FUNG|nr:hypothetical protein IWQ60_012409 [Tieghemiomyces parasiticus]
MRTSYKITCGALLVLLAMAIQPATALPGAAVSAPSPAAQAVSLGGADVGSHQSPHPEPVASPDSGDSATNLQAQSKVIVGYYPDWVTRSMQPEQIPYEKVTHINYGK